MRKLALRIDELQVESFAVTDREDDRGTVAAHGMETWESCNFSCAPSCRLCPMSDYSQCDCTEYDCA